jgi:hypothetical protein
MSAVDVKQRKGEPTVRVRGITLGLCRILTVLSEIASEMESPKRIVITSINDGAHGAKSRHYSNEAIDVRSRNFGSHSSKVKFQRRMSRRLGAMFFVDLEHIGTDNEHFHIQVRKGRTYP